MRLQSKLLQAATPRRPVQLSTDDITKLTKEDLYKLDESWRHGSDGTSFERIKLLKHWPKGPFQPYEAARYLGLVAITDDDEDDTVRAGGLVPVEVRKMPDGWHIDVDYDNMIEYPMFEEALMEFASHGLE